MKDDAMMYPSDGGSFNADTTFYADTPLDRQEEESKAAAVIASSYPIMADIAEWFHDQAMNAPDISNIDLQSKVPIEAQVLALQMYQTKMIEKAREFADWRAEQ